jgi:hypothetical protein
VTDLVRKLRSYPSSTCKDTDIHDAADRIEELEKELDKHRQVLVFIQMNIMDVLRPIPFQEQEDDE